MMPWKLRKRRILPNSQNFSSAYFSLAKFQLVSCNLSLAMIWQMTYTHKLPKLCSATLSSNENDSNVWIVLNKIRRNTDELLEENRAMRRQYRELKESLDFKNGTFRNIPKNIGT